jgi:starch synthase (maltosyl-transferring)
VERKKAGFSAWYEFFPRSVIKNSNQHGTFRDCIDFLPYVADMGFDIIYLPPIHPIGITKRKGPNNSPSAGPSDPGSPWAIGGKEGGHKSIHPELGGMDDLQELILKAKEFEIDISIDIALQCSPDHPYVKEHPEWFRQRPDGSVQYAENPPKKYEDIYPFDLETDDWRAMWNEFKSIFIFWIEKGISIFRVDNPHTKSMNFWGWLITEVRTEYPDVIFLSEAFTRPKLMYQLAKQGFTQSYTYFTWRNTKFELTEYMKVLVNTGINDFFRPNLWPNTPDILPEFLQLSGKPGFQIRLALASTLSSNYGIYGPAFELMDNQPIKQGGEEYLNSEKYEIKDWNIDDKKNLRRIIKQINIIRRDNPALHNNHSLQFHNIDNEEMICYSKHTEDFTNIILVVINLDPHHRHSGWLHFPVDFFGIDENKSYQMHDLIGGTFYLWHGAFNYVELDPGIIPVHIFKVRRKIRTEKDFDYFM